MISMDGATLASYYAFPPNRLGYCGTGAFKRALKEFLSGKTGPSGLRYELSRFRAHYAYLSLIARENGLEPFDLDVVRAFWTGNGLLENVGVRALHSFVRKDLLGGRQKARAEMLCKNLPEGILPHHSFNALYVNFVSNEVPRTIRNFDSCCITWGDVESVAGNTLLLSRCSVCHDGGFCIEKRESRAALARSGIRFLQEVERGDVVAVHWGMAVERLSGKNARLLRDYTLKNIRAINESRLATGCLR